MPIFAKRQEVERLQRMLKLELDSEPPKGPDLLLPLKASDRSQAPLKVFDSLPLKASVGGHEL